jgi:hypothetical protein
MSEDDATIEQTAREMISRDGTAVAASIAREWAEIAKGLEDPLAAETWRDIIDEIDLQAAAGGGSL